MKLLVGLGNPGTKYLNTRHNIGFDVTNDFVADHGSAFRRPFLRRARSCKLKLAGVDIMVLQPLTFMNDSGKAVAPVLRKHKLKRNDVMAVFDDVDLELGTLRIRESGGAGGHNGIKSLIEHLGGNDFVRLRIGVGPRPRGSDLVDFVLGEWPPEDEKIVRDVRQRAVTVLQEMFTEGVTAAMNRHN